MHQTNPGPRRGIMAVLLGVLVSGLMLANLAAAQDGPPPPTLIVTINGTKKLQMTAKQLIVRVENQDPNIARVSPLQDDPTSVLVTGLMAGTTRVVLTDKEKKSEAFDIIVQLDVAFLRKILQETVPSANITPLPVGTGAIILAGTVTKPEDIPIALSVAQSVAGNVLLTNALRVGGVQQVELCVSVARVARSQLRRMSFEFLYSGRNNVFASTLGQNLSFSGAFGLAGPTATLLPGNLFYGVVSRNSTFFGFLDALRNEGLTKILAEPKVVTISGRPASFLDGGEQAIPVPAGLGQIGVQFEEFGTRLNVLPIVLGNGKIHLEVEPEVSNLDPANGTSIGGTIVPGRDTQRVHTTVELETGQTFAIGGLVQRKIGGSTSKIPVLGDLPFVGAAFRSMVYNEEEDELLILVTPHLVDPLACNQLPQFLPGQETRSPDDFELFLEGILEAPRGQREVCAGWHYQAAWRNGPTAGQFPCGCDPHSHGACDCFNGGNGTCGSCGNGTCAAGGTCGTCGTAATPVTAPAAQPLPNPPVKTPTGMPTGATTMPPAVQAPAMPTGTVTTPAAVQGPSQSALETAPLSPVGPATVPATEAIRQTSLAAPVSLPPAGNETPASVQLPAPPANFGAAPGNGPR
jgi:pilus assembly protein CpaC